jgi:hypothetical protein
VPEAKRRRVVKGLRQAAREFEAYVEIRVLGEKSSGDLVKELRKYSRQVRRDLAARRRGANGQR